MRCFNDSDAYNTSLVAKQLMSKGLYNLGSHSRVNRFERFVSSYPILAYNEPTVPTSVYGTSPAELLFSANVTWTRPADKHESDIDMYQVH